MRYDKAAEVMVGKAKQKFKLAEFSFDSGLYDSCVSALYYSAFQYVTALFYKREKRSAISTLLYEDGIESSSFNLKSENLLLITNFACFSCPVHSLCSSVYKINVNANASKHVGIKDCCGTARIQENVL